jgi:ribosomal protein S4E
MRAVAKVHTGRPRRQVPRAHRRARPAGGAAQADARGRGAQVNDTVMFDIETGKIKDFIKFDVGQLVMVTGGRNQGRVGTIFSKEKHKGSFDICHVKDAQGHDFATRCARAAGHRV